MRQHLARADAILALSVIGVASGLATGAVIIAFRWLTESGALATALLGGPEGYTGLEWPLRVCLPVAGALFIGLAFQKASLGARQVGVVHVMDCLAYRSGRLPWRNAVLQFFGGAASILSGHSVGREGPVIHVGAASSSLLGQWLRLPHNSLRTLVACGTAAAIAASFNTPIAGVIFAMEVVMMEYTMIGFTPVLLASVAATSLSRAVYGPDPAFDVPALDLISLWELPYIVLVGLVFGALAAFFIQALRLLDVKLRHLSLWVRTTLAGVLVGLAGLVAPEVMGIGYQAAGAALLGEVALTTLLVIAALKLLATIACVGLGLPGGLIGPTLVIGATAGGALGIVGHNFAPETSAQTGLYALLGMGAMMGATLQAPLAALSAILELTHNPKIILPGMLAVVTATLAARVVFKQESVFVTLLKARGLDYCNDPVAVALARTGVGAVMSRRLATLAPRPSSIEIDQAVAGSPEWILVVDGTVVVSLLSAAALSKSRAQAGDAARDEPDALLSGCKEAFINIDPQSTLREALDALDESGMNVALVSRTRLATRNSVLGVLSRNAIDAAVRYGSANDPRARP